MTLKKFLISNWPILLILIIAAALRLWRIDQLFTFGGDLGYDLFRIREIIHGDLTLIGPPTARTGTTNLFLAPLYYYILTPFLLLTKLDPIGTIIPILLAWLTYAAVIYLIAKRIFGELPAIFSVIIISISPLWINESGIPNPPFFVPLIISVIFLFLLNFFQTEIINKRPVYIFLLGILTGLNINFHLTALSIFPVILLYLILRKATRNLGSIAIFITGFVSPFIPLILFDLRNSFFLTHQLQQQLATGISVISIKNNIQLALTLISRNLLGVEFSPLYSGVILIFLFIISILTFKKRKTKVILYLLIGSIVSNILIASVYGGSMQSHYLAASFPALSLFIGFFISSTGKINKYIPIFLIIMIASILFFRNDFLRSSGYTMPEDLTLKEIRKISQIIVQDVGNESFNITSTLDGDSRAMPYRYLVEVYGKTPQVVEYYDRGDSLYVLTRDPAAAVPQNPLFEIASFQPSNILRTWEIKGDIRLVKLSKNEKLLPKVEKFVTIVNPVRGRGLWQDTPIKNLEGQLETIKTKNLPATWLLQYDTLSDDEIINLLKSQDEKQEIGAFLEVSEKWATDAKVSYKVSDGDYYRPDKVFLSGYTPHDRNKLIKTYFDKFHLIFGKYPQSVGAWYIDANSQKYLSKLGAKIALTVADQYDTDAASVWGKYWGMPYYPSGYNSLEPAINQSNKIPVVNIQWAQRDLIAGYGKDIFASRNSFQANDYFNNGFDHTYFENLLSNYLNQKSDFVQITLGLEAGQEAVSFREEFANQLDKIKEMQNLGEIEAVKMEDFASWHQNKYPGISPSHFLQKDQSFWYMSPKFRVAIFKEGENFILKDLRYYSNIPLRDYLYADENSYLDRKVKATIDELTFGNELNLGSAQKLELVEKFDHLILKLDNREVQIDANGVLIDGKYLVENSDRGKEMTGSLNYLLAYQKITSPPKNILSVFKYSKINGKRIFGLATPGSRIVGFKGYVPQVFSFQFQSFSKFLSPADFIDKFQPWIN